MRSTTTDRSLTGHHHGDRWLQGAEPQPLCPQGTPVTAPSRVLTKLAFTLVGARLSWGAQAAPARLHSPAPSLGIWGFCAFQVRAMRLSFVGEMGWELHVPRADCVRVYRAVMEAGARHGITNAGYRAIDSLSIEKGLGDFPAAFPFLLLCLWLGDPGKWGLPSFGVQLAPCC